MKRKPHDRLPKGKKEGDVKNSERIFNIPSDSGLDGFQPSFCRKIHRNFYKMKGEPRQDRIKNAGRVPRRHFLRSCKKPAFNSSFQRFSSEVIQALLLVM
ncbi:MAG TPA: hypothetical protein DEV98_01895 [Clostridiales bacterium]|nr:hypothetical protein [Clostridiales bacterium]